MLPSYTDVDMFICVKQNFSRKAFLLQLNYKIYTSWEELSDNCSVCDLADEGTWWWGKVRHSGSEYV